ANAEICGQISGAGHLNVAQGNFSAATVLSGYAPPFAHLQGCGPPRASIRQREARAEHVLQRLLGVAPFVIGGDDRAVSHLRHRRIANMLVDAGVLPVDMAARELAGGGRHAARAGALADAPAGDAALTDDELVFDVPDDAVRRDDAARAVGRA